MDHTMELTPSEISYIGTDDELLHSKTSLRRGVSASAFDCQEYRFLVENAYKKYIPWSGPKIEKKIERDLIEKDRNSTGFYPTYICQKGMFRFAELVSSKNHSDAIRKILGDYLNFHWEGNVLIVSSKDPSRYLIEFDFYSGSHGPNISAITREEHVDRRWELNRRLGIIRAVIRIDGEYILEDYYDELLSLLHERGFKLEMRGEHCRVTY